MTIQQRFLSALAILGLLAGGALVWWAWRGGESPQSQASDTTAPDLPGSAGAANPATVTQPSRFIFAGPESTAHTSPAAGGGAAPASAAPQPATSPSPTAPAAVPDISNASPLKAEWLAIGGSDSSRVYVWSLEPVAPGLHPPASIMDEKWRDAVLTRTGGAAILRDESIAVWHVSSPDTAHRFTLPEGGSALQATPDEAVARGRNGTAYLLPSGPGGKARLLAGNIQTLHPSAQPGRMAASAEPSQITLLSLRLTNANRTFQTLWRSSYDLAALTADGKLWAVSTQNKLWMLPDGASDFTLFDEQPLSDLKPMGTTLLGLKEGDRGEVLTFNGGPPPPQQPPARELLAVDGMALAVGLRDTAVIWGSRVPGGVREFRLPERTSQIRLGPSGLMVAW